MQDRAIPDLLPPAPESLPKWMQGEEGVRRALLIVIGAGRPDRSLGRMIRADARVRRYWRRFKREPSPSPQEWWLWHCCEGRMEKLRVAALRLLRELDLRALRGSASKVPAVHPV